MSTEPKLCETTDYDLICLWCLRPVAVYDIGGLMGGKCLNCMWSRADD